MEQTFVVVVETTSTGYSAYVPDLPGCVSTGRTLVEVQANMQEAIALHLEGMREGGEEIPQPRSQILSTIHRDANAQDKGF